MLLKRNKKFGEKKEKKKKKKNPPPLPPQKWACFRKNHKRLRFSNFRLKKTNLMPINAQKLTLRDFEPMK